MKSFHKTMGYLSGVFLLMIILSVSISSSYMKNNNIGFTDLFAETGSLTYNSSNNISFWNSGKKSSSYETIKMNESNTFELVDELFISVSIEEVEFIEEDRDDILVEFYRELPDTKNYEVKYTTTATSNKLSISSTLKSKNISINKSYKGSVTIHVPKDYQFEKVTLDSGAAKITTDNIYTHTNSLSAIASFGDIDISIDSPIDEVIISCNFGSIDVEVNEAIKELDVTCDMGKINLTINDTIDELTISEDMGDIELNASAKLGSIEIENSMGAIRADFQEYVQNITIQNDMGDIDVTFYDNDDMTIYIDTDLGSVNSDFPTTSSKSNTNYIFTNNMGSVKVHNK